MKKPLLVLLSVLCLFVVARSQQLSYGAKVGLNFSSMDTEGESIKMGFNGGVFAQLKIAKFSIQPELLYSMQGAKYDYETQWGDIIIQYTGKVNTTYLSVPIMLQYNIISGLKLEVGPQFGFLLSAKNKPDDWESKDIKDSMKEMDIAVNFGASYKLPMAPVGFYARYSLGVTDIFEKHSYVVFEREKGKNKMIQLGMFVQF